MSSRGVVALSDVLAMLEGCAPGFTMKKTQHHVCVRYNGHTFPTLPLGEHGSKRSKGRCEIKGGHVKRMIHALRINIACAAEHLPSLKFSEA